jgi:short-subunit dehydrogenase
MSGQIRQLAVVTGASTGIGFELARICAQNNYDLIIAADEPEIRESAGSLASGGSMVIPVQCDLATREGVSQLLREIESTGRPVDALLANAGRGLGKAFLDQDLEQEMLVAHTNIDGTLRLIHPIARGMRDRGQGRILITGSIAGFMPGTFQSVYNGTKAFLDSFSAALATELKHSGVTVTCLMPGATETEFFERADMMDTKVGTAKKMDAAQVARIGFDAMMKGELSVIAGLKNKMQAAMAHVLPDGVLAEMHNKQAAPGTAKQ